MSKFRMNLTGSETEDEEGYVRTFSVTTTGGDPTGDDWRAYVASPYKWFLQGSCYRSLGTEWERSAGSTTEHRRYHWFSLECPGPDVEHVCNRAADHAA